MKKGGRLSSNKVAYILLVVGTIILFAASYASVQNIGEAGILAPVLILIGGAMLVISFLLGQKE